MGIIRPATPGFLVTLVATILLAVVSFSVPWFKSVYFLKASLEVEGINGTITFGTLGYCTTISGSSTNCSSPSIGYELDINALVGNDTSISIPEVVVKWVTYALVLHIVALVLSAGSALFGLLAHVREFSMTCCSTCVSGFAAVIALLAFIFDLVFFFLAKSRLNDVSGGSATMGNGIWITLAAWVLLFFSGCVYGIGRCCIRRNPRHPYSKHKDGADGWNREGSAAGGVGYEEQMRLDAVKAEADRKARQKQGEQGLPAFQEYDPTQPLTSGEEDEQPALHYQDNHSQNQHNLAGAAAAGVAGAGAGAYVARRNHSQRYAGGYAPAPENTRAVDEYYSPTNQYANNNAYPPQPRRQGSQATSAYTAATSNNYANVGYGAAAGAAAGAAYGHQQYPTQASGQYPAHEQYPSQVIYGHAMEPSNNTYADPYNPHPRSSPPNTYANQASSYYTPAADYSSPYSAQSRSPPVLGPPSGQVHATAAAAAALGSDSYYSNGSSNNNNNSSNYNPYSTPTQTRSPPPQQPQQSSQRTYTLGGGGYGDNTVPELPQSSSLYGGAAANVASPSHTASPQPLNVDTAVGGAAAGVSSPKGPRQPQQQMVLHGSPVDYEDSPPVYDEGLSQPAGQWGAKH